MDRQVVCLSLASGNTLAIRDRSSWKVWTTTSRVKIPKRRNDWVLVTLRAGNIDIERYLTPSSLLLALQ